MEATRISGPRTRAIFDRYNIVDEADLVSAGKSLEEYAKRRKQEGNPENGGRHRQPASLAPPAANARHGEPARHVAPVATTS